MVSWRASVQRPFAPTPQYLSFLSSLSKPKDISWSPTSADAENLKVVWVLYCLLAPVYCVPQFPNNEYTEDGPTFGGESEDEEEEEEEQEQEEEPAPVKKKVVKKKRVVKKKKAGD